ncbi:lipase family protein [Mycolicibacterium hodleri]|uniref:Lipase n=1 Tax=Mycolicibacterium hodleri TaxID=49897 RepID=A0A502E4I5_9MYCO|nr:lipase family protein [Mycolicibacterium hodleri]TPG32234.1 lipase [Mycolicibacterium hodleri]
MDSGSAAASTGADWIGRPPHQELRRKSHPVLPDADPFHVPPAGFEHSRPGTVLRSRDVELAFLGLVPQKLTATQLLYRSTDLNGLPMAAVTTVVVPADRPTGDRGPILSYQCAIDAVAGQCFPSYALRRGARAIGALAQFEFLLVSAALAEGWAVSIPDHEGPQGIWGAPYEPGYHVLDGLRAALNHESLNLSSEAPIGLWGYSGGGLATAWATEVYSDYAPELNVVGAVLGSPVGDLGHTFRRLNGSFFSGLPAMVVAALSHVYPDLDRVINEHVTAEGKAMLTEIQRMTTARVVLKLIHEDMGNLVDEPLENILGSPEVQHVFDSIKLGTAAPTVPVLVVQAVHDRIVAVEDIDALTHTYARGGASVTYHRDMFSEHMLLHPMSAPMTLRWLRDRFAGKPVSSNRARTKWPTLLNISTYRGMLRLAVISAKVVTGRRVDRLPLSDLDQ